MSYCAFCGAANQEDAAFCSQCGAELQGAVPQSANEYGTSTAANPFQVGADSRTVGNYDLTGEAPEVPNPIRAVAICLKKYASTKGRAGRAEIWGFWLFTGFVGVLLATLMSFASATPNRGEFEILTNAELALLLIGLAFGLLTLLPHCCVFIRRLHDLGMSGWFLLLLMIPWLGGLIALVISLTPGQPYPNEYGLPPQRKLR